MRRVLLLFLGCLLLFGISIAGGDSQDQSEKGQPDSVPLLSRAEGNGTVALSDRQDGDLQVNEPDDSLQTPGEGFAEIFKDGTLKNALHGRRVSPHLLVQNGRVHDYLNYFLKTRFGFFSDALARSGRYLPMMKEVFKENGLPVELVYLSLIESGFRMDARSHSMAVGPWQFIRSTGNRYGLLTTRWIDERMDPIKSTEAAASYLRDLHRKLGHWHLAVAGYHAGGVKVERALVNSSTDNFWDLAETDHLQEATRNYVPKFIAATLIAKSPQQFGLKSIRYHPPFEFDRVSVDRPVDLKKIATLAGTNVSVLRELNPALLSRLTPPDYPRFQLRVPKGMGRVIQARLVTPVTRMKMDTDQDKQRRVGAFHVVKKGESAYTIARKHDMKLHDLLAANQLPKKHRLFPGDRLKLVQPSSKSRITP